MFKLFFTDFLRGDESCLAIILLLFLLLLLLLLWRMLRGVPGIHCSFNRIVGTTIRILILLWRWRNIFSHTLSDIVVFEKSVGQTRWINGTVLVCFNKARSGRIIDTRSMSLSGAARHSSRTIQVIMQRNKRNSHVRSVHLLFPQPVLQERKRSRGV